MPHFCSKGVCPASPALKPRQPRICPEKASEPRITLVLNPCFKSCVQLFVLKPGLSVVTQGCRVVWVNGFLPGPALHSVTLFRTNAPSWPPVHLARALTPVRPLPTHRCHSPSRAACPEPDLAWLPLRGDSLLSSRAPRPDIFRPSFRTGSRPGHHAPFSSLSTSPAPSRVHTSPTSLSFCIPDVSPFKAWYWGSSHSKFPSLYMRICGLGRGRAFPHPLGVTDVGKTPASKKHLSWNIVTIPKSYGLCFLLLSSHNLWENFFPRPHFTGNSFPLCSRGPQTCVSFSPLVFRSCRSIRVCDGGWNRKREQWLESLKQKKSIKGFPWFSVSW